MDFTLHYSYGNKKTHGISVYNSARNFSVLLFVDIHRTACRHNGQRNFSVTKRIGAVFVYGFEITINDPETLFMRMLIPSLSGIESVTAPEIV
jgi:hypothetical protein